jgi:hypothetical protein
LARRLGEHEDVDSGVGGGRRAVRFGNGARWLETGTAGSHYYWRLDGRCAASDLVLLVHVANQSMSAYIRRCAAHSRSKRETSADAVDEGSVEQQAGVKWGRMKQATKQKTNKKIVIEHLYKAIATMRSQQGHNSEKGQVQRVVEIRKRDYDVSVPDSLYKTIGRRIREFNARQS